MLFDADSERSLFDTPFQRKGDLTELLSVRQDLSSWSREFGRSGLRMCQEEDERFVPQTRELFRRLTFIYVGCIRSHILSRRTQLRHLLLALPSHTDVFLTPYHEMSIFEAALTDGIVCTAIRPILCQSERRGRDRQGEGVLLSITTCCRKMLSCQTPKSFPISRTSPCRSLFPDAFG